MNFWKKSSWKKLIKFKNQKSPRPSGYQKQNKKLSKNAVICLNIISRHTHDFNFESGTLLNFDHQVKVDLNIKPLQRSHLESVRGPDMGVCAGECLIPTFTNFNLRDFFFGKSGFSITFGSETFRSFNFSEDDSNIV